MEWLQWSITGLAYTKAGNSEPKAEYLHRS